jgi:hypothetical protein
VKASTVVRWTLPTLCLLTALSITPTAVYAQDTTEETTEPYSNARTRKYRLHLDWNQIGLIVPKGTLRYGSLIRMHPSGFRADEYSNYLAPTYGFAEGWEVTAGVSGAERMGPGGNALFYGAGLQRQLMKETRSLPAVSVGLYGMAGPHSHQSGTLYVAATKEVWSKGKRAVFLHGGGKFEAYDSDDYGNSTGLRPYGGTTLVITPRVFLAGEISPSQPWESATPYAVRVTYRIHKKFSVSGGVRNNGFETETFIGLGL